MLLDFLIPPPDNESLGGFAVWAWNSERHDLTSKVIEALEEISEEGGSEKNIETLTLLLKSRYKVLYLELTESLLIDYFTHPDVKDILGQNPSSPFPIGYTVKPTDWTILEQVFHKLPIYRSQGETLS